MPWGLCILFFLAIRRRRHGVALNTLGIVVLCPSPNSPVRACPRPFLKLLFWYKTAVVLPPAPHYQALVGTLPTNLPLRPSPGPSSNSSLKYDWAIISGGAPNYTVTAPNGTTACSTLPAEGGAPLDLGGPAAADVTQVGKCRRGRVGRCGRPGWVCG